MKTKLANAFGLLTLALVSNSSFALQTTATLAVNLVVNQPICTVKNSADTVKLPTITNPTLTFADFKKNNALTEKNPNFNYFSSAALNQTATVECNTANVVLSSFVVKPLVGRVGDLATASLIDSAATPAIAFKSAALMAEQLKVNGVAAPGAYAQTTAPYDPKSTTGVTTGDLDANTSKSTATVEWRPMIGGVDAEKVGLPAGGSFKTNFVISIDY